MDSLKTFVKDNPGLSTSEIARILKHDRHVVGRELRKTCKALTRANNLVLWYPTAAAAKAAEKAHSEPLEIADPVERRQAERADARLRREHGELTKEVEALRESMRLRDALAAAPLPAI